MLHINAIYAGWLQRSIPPLLVSCFAGDVTIYREERMTVTDLPLTFDTLLHVQQLRKKKLRSFCSTNAKVTKLPLTQQEISQVLSSIMVNNKLQFLYCKIPSAGVEGWEHLLDMLEGKGDVTLQMPIHYLQQFGTDKRLCLYNRTSIDAMLKSYTKVIFIREPFQRLISAYMHGLAEGLTFKEFIQYILDRGSKNASTEWKPLVHLCRPCLIQYDSVILFGFLDSEVRHLMHRAGLPGHIQFPEFIDSKIQWTYSWLEEQMLSELSLMQRQQLCHYFRLDFAAFHFPSSLLRDLTCLSGSS